MHTLPTIPFNLPLRRDIAGRTSHFSKTKITELSNTIWAFATAGIRGDTQVELVKFMADALDEGRGQFFGFQFKRKLRFSYLLFVSSSRLYFLLQQPYLIFLLFRTNNSPRTEQYRMGPGDVALEAEYGSDRYRRAAG